MTRIAVFASGGGSILQAMLDTFRPADADASAEITLVVSNNADAFALERAGRCGVPAMVVDHRGRSREAFETALAAAIEPYRPDLLCLAGFLRILSPSFVARYCHRILNTHPALLPAFGGKGMYGERVHQAVLDAGVAVSGCTIHLVDDTPDGGPIVAQAAVPVLEGDTPEGLAARVQVEERRLYPEVIRWWANGRIEVHDRAVVLHPARSVPHPVGEPAARPANAIPV